VTICSYYSPRRVESGGTFSPVLCVLCDISKLRVAIRVSFRLSLEYLYSDQSAKNDHVPLTGTLTQIQFGTPHYGISALIPCPTPPSISCLLAARAARLGTYTTYAQNNLIQAQYYRDVERLDEFMAVNTFLRDINGELKGNTSSGVELSLSLSDQDQDQDQDDDHHEDQDLDHDHGNRTGREGGGGGVKGLENFVAVMFDEDRE
jgi:hypothetical protein